MTTGQGFGPVRPFGAEFPPVNPNSSDPRDSFSIATGSVTNEMLAGGISPKKIAMIGAKVYMTAAQTITTGAAGETLVWDVASFDEGAFWVSGDTITVPEAGIYIISSAIEWASDGTGNYRKAFIDLNGSDAEGVSVTPLTGTPTRFTLAAVRKLAAGDDITIRVAHDKGSNLQVNGGEDNASLTAVFLGVI